LRESEKRGGDDSVAETLFTNVAKLEHHATPHTWAATPRPL